MSEDFIKGFAEAIAATILNLEDSYAADCIPSGGYRLELPTELTDAFTVRHWTEQELIDASIDPIVLCILRRHAVQLKLS